MEDEARVSKILMSKNPNSKTDNSKYSKSYIIVFKVFYRDSYSQFKDAKMKRKFVENFIIE